MKFILYQIQIQNRFVVNFKIKKEPEELNIFQRKFTGIFNKLKGNDRAPRLYKKN